MKPLECLRVKQCGSRRDKHDAYRVQKAHTLGHQEHLQFVNKEDNQWSDFIDTL